MGREHPNSRKSERLDIYLQLCEHLQRTPNTTELMAAWRVKRYLASAIVRQLKVEAARTPRPVTDQEASHHQQRAADLIEVTAKIGRKPTQRTLAERWGVSVTRVGQILHSKTFQRYLETPAP